MNVLLIESPPSQSMKCANVNCCNSHSCFWHNHKPECMERTKEKSMNQRQTSGRNGDSQHYRNSGMKSWQETRGRGTRGRGSSREQNRKHTRKEVIS